MRGAVQSQSCILLRVDVISYSPVGVTFVVSACRRAKLVVCSVCKVHMYNVCHVYTHLSYALLQCIVTCDVIDESVVGSDVAAADVLSDVIRSSVVVSREISVLKIYYYFKN